MKGIYQSEMIFVHRDNVPSFPPQYSKSVTAEEDKGLPITEATIRLTLRKMCRIPIIANIVGGVASFSFDTKNKFYLPKCSFNFIIPILQNMVQISFIIYYYANLEYYFTGKMSERESFIYAAVFTIGTICQGFTRLIYAFFPQKFLKFHEKLTILSCHLIQDDSSLSVTPAYLDFFAGVEIYMKRLGRRGIFMLTFIIGAYALLEQIRSEATANPEEMSMSLLSRISLGVFKFDIIVIILAYGSHVFWIVLYMKWMEAGFAIISEKSSTLLREVKTDSCSEIRDKYNPRGLHPESEAQLTFVSRLLEQLQELEGLVRDFNSIFQYPILFWLSLITTAISIMMYFAFLSFSPDDLVKVPWWLGVTVVALLYVCRAGSAFTEKVKGKVEIFHKSASGVLKIIMKNGHDYATPVMLYVELETLHNKLEANPISISVQNVGTLNWEMIPLILKWITTIVVLALQGK